MKWGWFVTLSLCTALNADPLSDLDTDGFTVIENLWDAKDLQFFQEGLEKAKIDAFSLMEKAAPKQRIFYENGTRNESRYWKEDPYLIMQAGAGRYDFFRGFQKNFFESGKVGHPVLNALMQKLLGGEYTRYAGVILALAGSQDQYWHRDTNTLSNTNTTGDKLVALDDFYFTVLIPITVPLTLENGTTEFMIGSHRLPSTQFEHCQSARLHVPLGAALVFNGKINHRGRANYSTEDRPVLYLVFHKRWYDDSTRAGIE
jgi:ectoine hydroxylase-related dioxygenase (phytanoyl-CoA dioxygenase family)